jgi:polyvinyl alcohol dehydrogenase (cytochrome)
MSRLVPRWGVAAAALLAGMAPGVVTGAGAMAPTAAPTHPPCAGTSPWPLVGANLSNTRDVAGGPTPAQVRSLKVLWRFHASDGDFTGTPVVGDCMVFVGSNGGWVRALDEQTGQLVWQVHLGGPIPSSAAFAGNRVFVAVANPGAPSVAALDASTGALLWDTTIDVQADSDAYGSPVVSGGTVYEGVAGLVTSEVSSSSIHVRGGLVALDASSGALRWHTYTVPPGRDGGAIWSSPSLDRSTGLLYVGDGNAYHSPAAPTTDSVLVFDSRTGALLQHFQATSGDVFNGVANPTGPDLDFGAAPNLLTLPGGVKAVGVGQKAGVYWMLRRSDLKPIWDTRVGTSDAFGGVVGSTAVDAHDVYGPNTLPGYLWALHQRGGHLAWIDPSLDPLHYGPASVSNGVVYTDDSDGFLDCVDASDGLLLTRIPLNTVPTTSYAEAYGGVSIANGTVFTDTGSQSSEGDVIALGTLPPGRPGRAGPYAGGLPELAINGSSPEGSRMPSSRKV